MPVATDTFGRPLRSLRLSVTDRCNLRCTYCMPEENYVWLPRADLLSFDECVRVVDRFVHNGADRLRITGGEPLLRTDLSVLVTMLSARPGVRDVALTTNGILLPRFGEALRSAGLQRVTLSLDTLRADRFTALAGRDDLERALAGLDCATELWPGAVKINTVAMRGQNDDELLELLEFARDRGVELRFIEYMDVGGATGWNRDRVLSRREILQTIGDAVGVPQPVGKDGAAPADRFELPSGQVFGVISSTTEPFCRTCDRSRLTADGMWYTCLYARSGVNIRDAMRAGATDVELDELIRGVWSRRTDRAAEQRAALAARSPLAGADELREDPHLEMHTRGG